MLQSAMIAILFWKVADDIVRIFFNGFWSVSHNEESVSRKLLQLTQKKSRLHAVLHPQMPNATKGYLVYGNKHHSVVEAL